MKKKIEELFLKTASGIKPGLDITKNLLKNLNNPHKDFISVHIAGTNGKGSTAVYLAEILNQSGFKTGIYTSPHLYDFRERIKVSGQMVGEAALGKIFDIVETADNKERKATFFEFTTAAAFKYFSDQKIDIAVIETGMGGKFDSTNVIEPVLSIITNVSVEHTDYLGTDLAQIAHEKAGIIKQNIPVVTCADNSIVSEIIKKTASKKNSPAFFINKDFSIVNKNNSFYVESFNTLQTVLEPSLPGRHQITNAAAAAFSCKILNRFYPDIFSIDNKTIENGIKSAKHRGRLEKISDNPETIVDCAHNPHSCSVLMEYLRSTGKNIIFVFGALKDKDFEKNLKILEPVCKKIFFTKPDSERALLPEELLSISQIKKSYKEPDPLKALLRAQSEADSDDIVCVAGSVYLAGKIIEAFDKGII
jgi:dihydrofolate synthase/folylpolyglutamate synthase